MNELTEEAPGNFVLQTPRTEITDHQWRCTVCNNMQPANTLLTWIPDQWAASVAARIPRQGGNFVITGESFWSGACERCVNPPKLCIQPVKLAADTKRLSWWQRTIKSIFTL